MRAAVLTRHAHPLSVTDVPDPTLPRDGVVVSVFAAGLCGTDAHLWNGDWDWAGVRLSLPRILGHEMAGTVVAVGDAVRSIEVGDRVTVPFHLSCGFCANCRSGLSNTCTEALYLGSSQDGAFGELMAVPRADINSIRLDDKVSLASGASLGCRYMTTFRGLVDLARLEPGETLLVLGSAGGVGAASVQLGRALGATVLGVDLSAKRALTIEYGAHFALDASDPDILDHILDLSNGGANVAVDGVAGLDSTSLAVNALATHGRLVQIGLTGPHARGIVKIPIDRFVHKELSLMGVSGNPHSRFGPLMALVASGRCDPAALIDRTVDFTDISGELERIRDKLAFGQALLCPSRTVDV